MANIDTLFMTKAAEKPTFWGRTYLYGLCKGVPPPPGVSTISSVFIAMNFYLCYGTLLKKWKRTCRRNFRSKFQCTSFQSMLFFLAEVFAFIVTSGFDWPQLLSVCL